MTTNETPRYYVPESSPWPLVGAIGLIFIAVGGANFIQQSTGIVPNEGTIPGGPVLAIGFAIIFFMHSVPTRVGNPQSMS